MALNDATLKKLESNIHYKISEKNKKKKEEPKKQPMVAFGRPQIHNVTRPIHPTGPERQHEENT